VKIAHRAADLAAALAFIRRGVEQKATVDVLRTALLRTAGDGVEIVGHTLERCHVARCAATVHMPGAIAVPAHRLAALIDATPPDTMVTITHADGAATVAAGRSRYRLPAMHASSFPIVLTPAADAITLDLTDADLAALLGRPAELASVDHHRPHFNGIYLHTVDGKLAAAVTDGIALLRRASTIAVPGLPGGGIIVPLATAEEIVRLARRTSVTLATDGRLLEARVDGGRHAIVSKLIDVSFPDYARAVPPPASTTATFAAADMLGALARLTATSSHEHPAVGLTWDGGDALSLCLAQEGGIATDVIAAATTSSGRVACAAALLTKVIKTMNVARLRLSIDAVPGATLRLDPLEDGAVAVIAPIRWSAAAAAAAA
jgi:DNA polymerase-3 subunit beta